MKQRIVLFLQKLFFPILVFEKYSALWSKQNIVLLDTRLFGHSALFLGNFTSPLQAKMVCGHVQEIMAIQYQLERVLHSDQSEYFKNLVRQMLNSKCCHLDVIAWTSKGRFRIQSLLLSRSRNLDNGLRMARLPIFIGCIKIRAVLNIY